MKKAIKEKEDRRLADGLLAGPGGTPFGEDEWWSRCPFFQGGEEEEYSPSFASTAAADSRLLRGETIQNRIKKQVRGGGIRMYVDVSACL